ncbi:MAG: PD-(D/E)XK nuclease family transposase [Bacteroidia bacterium]
MDTFTKATVLNRHCRSLRIDVYDIPIFSFSYKLLLLTINHLHQNKSNNRPKSLQEKVFGKLFEAAEIARFTPEEKEAYQESLKYYRDLKNVVDTSQKGLWKAWRKGK